MLPLVVQVERTDEHVADTLAFKKSPVRIGRNPLNDLQLDEPFISQWHAVIRFRDGRTSYVDLGSTNRTVIDGRSVERNVEVEINDQSDIRIGPLRLHVLRTTVPPEFFGRRRKSAFGQSIAPDAEPDQGLSTIQLSPDAVKALMAQAMAKGAPAAAPASSSRPAPAVPAAPPVARPGASAAPPASRPAPAAPHTPRPVSNAPPPVTDASAFASTVLAGRGSAAVPPSADPPSRIPSGAPRPFRPSGAPAPRGGTLEECHTHFRESWDALLSAVQKELDATPSHERAQRAAQLQQRIPQLAQAPELRSDFGGGAQPAAHAAPGEAHMADWLRRLTQGMFPQPGVTVDIAMAMERVGQLLEIFSEAFIELRRAQEQFCNELSLERYTDDSLLHHTEDPRALLAYLLTPSRQSESRTTELARGLADFTLHQVGLVSAVVEGARSLMGRLAPEAVGQSPEPPRDSPAFASGAVPGPWSGASRKLWKRYLAQHYDLMEGDRFMRQLFGREFVRRYYAVTGGEGRDS